MQTPWGRLADLDLTSLDLCGEIISNDKHQLAEGLVVESLIDQIYERIPPLRPSATLLDVDTAVVRHRGRWLAFVLVHSRQSGLGRYLIALEKAFQVHVVERAADGDLVLRRWREGGLIGEAAPLEEGMAALSGRLRPEPVTVAHEVRDIRRHRASFWGYLTSRYGPELGARVVLPRLFLNYGIQPWFRAVWNLDRVLVDGDQTWFLEIKHKYPMEGRALAFGLNRGEADVIDVLATAGIRCLHTILVKPRWDKSEGAGYLLAGLEQREQALVIAAELDAAAIARMRSGGQRSSGADTTYAGKGSQNYHSIPASSFHLLGTFSSPSPVAAAMSGMLEGKLPPLITDDLLRQHRIDAPRR